MYQRVRTQFEIRNLGPSLGHGALTKKLCLGLWPISSYKGPHTEHNLHTFPLLLH